MTDTPTSYLAAARTAVRVARREAVDERDALDQFCQRVESLPAAGSRPERAPDPTCAAVVRGDGHDGLDAVRTAYEGTVMAVPHERAPYGVAFVEHVAAELGADVATALRRETSLSPTLKADLVAATQAARERRIETVRALDEESAALDCAERGVRDLLDALADGGQGTDRDDGRHLATLQSRCDDLAAERRSTLADPEYGLATPDTDTGVDTDTDAGTDTTSARPTLAAVYEDLPVRDPVLATLASLGQLLAERRADSGRS